MNTFTTLMTANAGATVATRGHVTHIMDVTSAVTATNVDFDQVVLAGYDFYLSNGDILGNLGYQPFQTPYSMCTVSITGSVGTIQDIQGVGISAVDATIDGNVGSISLGYVLDAFNLAIHGSTGNVYVSQADSYTPCQFSFFGPVGSVLIGDQYASTFITATLNQTCPFISAPSIIFNSGASVFAAYAIAGFAQAFSGASVNSLALAYNADAQFDPGCEVLSLTIYDGLKSTLSIPNGVSMDVLQIPYGIQGMSSSTTIQAQNDINNVNIASCQSCTFDLQGAVLSLTQSAHLISTLVHLGGGCEYLEANTSLTDIGCSVGTVRGSAGSIYIATGAYASDVTLMSNMMSQTVNFEQGLSSTQLLTIDGSVGSLTHNDPSGALATVRTGGVLAACSLANGCSVSVQSGGSINIDSNSDMTNVVLDSGAIVTYY